jgi:hypothetical protein
MLQILPKIDAENLRPDDAREDRPKGCQQAEGLGEAARAAEQRNHHRQPSDHHPDSEQHATVHDSERLQGTLPDKRRLIPPRQRQASSPRRAPGRLGACWWNGSRAHP